MDKTNALSLRGDGTFRNGPTLTYLIDDEFTDTVAAGSVNGTAATPGPGTRTVTDTENKLSVGSGVLAIAGGTASPTTGNPSVGYDGISRSAGIAYIVNFSMSSVGTMEVGADNSVGGNARGGTIFEQQAATELRYYDGATLIATASPLAPATTYVTVNVERSAGSFAIIKGGIYTDWTLFGVSTINTAATQHLAILGGTAVLNATYARVLQLPAPFDTDDGIATDTKSGSVAAGTTFSHEANALIEATITTVPSADNIDIVFRQQDASNYWICRVATGGDISLQEVVAGSPTQRGVAAGVVSNGHRVVVIADGTTIKGYSNNTLRWTYSSATNFATATAGEVDALGTGGAVSDLKTWPRTLSGTAASILNKASA